MKLHDLQVGQRFTFTDKHRGKVFEVVGLPDGNSMLGGILFQGIDDAWLHQVPKGHNLWDSEVQLHGIDRTVTITPHEVDMLKQVLHERYLLMCEAGYSEASKSEMDKLIIKITGLPGRRVVLPDDQTQQP